MAASESKPHECCTSETGKNQGSRSNETSENRYNECNKFGGLDVIFYAPTIAIFAATILTDTSVVIEHWLKSHKSWAYYTVFLAFVPSCFLQVLSLKWFHTSGALRQRHWISHIFHLAILHRFCFLLNYAIKNMKTQLSPHQKDWIFRIESDAFTLNLFTSILVSVPQIILQVYIMATLQNISFWASASIIASLCSLIWALASYALVINRANQDSSQFTWSSMMIQGFWRGGMLASRIAALVLAAICFKTWILVIFGIHTLGMTAWIIQQTNFCLTAIEELAYKCLIGAVYFIDFFRLSDNQVRYHVCVFYTVMIIENAIFYIIYLVSYKDLFQTNVLIVSTVLIPGGTFVGAISMLIHFCMFQNFKTLKLCKRVSIDPEVSLKRSPIKSISGKSPNKKWNNELSINESGENTTPDITADKKSLLTNIVQNPESLEKGIINTSFMKNDETNVTVQVVVEDNKVTNVDVSIEKLQGHPAPDKNNFEDTCSVDLAVETLDRIEKSNTDSLHRQKRRGICSEIELDLKPGECNIDIDPQLSLQKRRGICSLTQLGLELVTDEDNYVEKSFSLDKLKSDSSVSVNIQDKSLDSAILDSLPIKNIASEENREIKIPENILIRGRLNTPVISERGETPNANQLSNKETDTQKQEEETMSCVTSIHDYENVCPIGVARPPWCIRSWRGYTDIETYIHDDSVVRDRRRDTLTSTATGTTFSSDFSDTTYASLPLRKLMRKSRQDDYLDTLIYDLADWESISNKALTDEISTTASETMDEPQDQANLFSAKPIVIDDKGGMLPLDTILEEREDHSNSIPELRMSLCNPSSLVATIDEIRKCTAENSPRHVYHRTESQWEDLEQKILMKRAQLTKVLFANDYSNVTVNYADPWANSFLSKDDNDKLRIIEEMTNYCLKDSHDKTPLINAILSDSPILASKTETQNCENDRIEEDNVYVDMNALNTQRCTTEERKEIDTSSIDKNVLLQNNSNLRSEDKDTQEKVDGCNRKKVAFALTNEIINEAFDTASEKSDSSSVKSTDDIKNTTLSLDKRRRAINRPRRKFSLLRERFEPKSAEQIVCVVTPNKFISNRPQLNSLNRRISAIFSDQEAFDSSINYDKENLTSKPSILDANNTQVDNLKEKRSMFLKQVLTPPRFQGWGKKRTFSPNAKIIPKAH